MTRMWPINRSADGYRSPATDAFCGCMTRALSMRLPFPRKAMRERASWCLLESQTTVLRVTSWFLSHRQARKQQRNDGPRRDFGIRIWENKSKFRNPGHASFATAGRVEKLVDPGDRNERNTRPLNGWKVILV